MEKINKQNKKYSASRMSPELCGLIILLVGIGVIVTAMYGAMWYF